MKLNIIEKTIIERRLKDEKYGFEIPLNDIWLMIHYVTDEDVIDKCILHEMTDKTMIPYLVDNKILVTEDNHDYRKGENFEEFSNLIYNKNNYYEY